MKNRLTDIFDIFDIFGTSNVAPPEPLHPADELVLRGAANMVIGFTCTSQVELLYGDRSTVYLPGTYNNVILDNEENEDVVLRGDVQQIILQSHIEYISVSDELAVIVFYSYMRIIDCRNAGYMFATINNYSPSVPVNTDTVYAIADRSPQADAIALLINRSSVSDGTLYIDRTQPYADTITDAATAKGWRIYDL